MINNYSMKNINIYKNIYKRSRARICVLLSAVIAVMLSFAVCAVSCGVGYTDEEVIGAASELIQRSHEINEIYFGDGLPVTGDRDEIEAFYDMLNETVYSEDGIKALNYYPVDPECGYSSIDDIKAATREVYSAAYSEYLFERAFTGISDTMGSGDKTTVVTASYARYIEDDGVLTVRLNCSDDKLDLSRTYDVSGAKVVLKKKDFAIISVPSVKDGAPSENVELKLVLENSSWKLDTPTY